MRQETTDRTTSFGEQHELTWVDRWGIWLSARKVRRFVASFAGKAVGDFGCGYSASFARQLIGVAADVTLIDLSIAPDLKRHPRVRAIEGCLPEAIGAVESGSLDVVLCLSVLEHLWHPLELIGECHRVLAPGGLCLVNVPSWRGKRYLELSAFRLGLSPRLEIDDHKCYYDPNDLWPLLVRAGFLPSGIRCFKHKFGLNTFAACLRDGREHRLPPRKGAPVDGVR
jgi:SAM-dependent methyltransferase